MIYKEKRKDNAKLQEGLSKTLRALAQSMAMIKEYADEMELRGLEARPWDGKRAGFYRDMRKLAGQYHDEMKLCEAMAVRLLLGLNGEQEIKEANT